MRREDILRLGDLENIQTNISQETLSLSFFTSPKESLKILRIFKRTSILLPKFSLFSPTGMLLPLKLRLLSHLCVSLPFPSFSSLSLTISIQHPIIFKCVMHFPYFPSKGQHIKKCFFYCLSNKRKHGFSFPPPKNRKSWLHLSMIQHGILQ